MSVYNPEIFDTIQDIPDLIDASLLIPTDHFDTLAPTCAHHDRGAISPIELSYIYLGDRVSQRPNNAQRIQIELAPKENRGLDMPYRAIEGAYGSHVNRAFLRVILHPNREDLFNMEDVYNRELIRTARAANEADERPEFKYFVRRWGVLKRP
jgi:hypothetical protein